VTAATGIRRFAVVGAAPAPAGLAAGEAIGAVAGAGTVGTDVGVVIAPVTPDWSARANSAAVGGRSAARGASARWIACSTASGTLGRAFRTLGTGSVNRFMMMAGAVGPVYGGSPASIS
jgi:hypothetical protein